MSIKRKGYRSTLKSRTATQDAHVGRVQLAEQCPSRTGGKGGGLCSTQHIQAQDVVRHVEMRTGWQLLHRKAVSPHLGDGPLKGRVHQGPEALTVQNGVGPQR
jgi:hypothetical protein